MLLGSDEKPCWRYEREGQQENICYDTPVLYSPTSLSSKYNRTYIILFSTKTKYVKGVCGLKKKHQQKQM